MIMNDINVQNKKETLSANVSAVFLTPILLEKRFCQCSFPNLH